MSFRSFGKIAESSMVSTAALKMKCRAPSCLMHVGGEVGAVATWQDGALLTDRSWVHIHVCMPSKSDKNANQTQPARESLSLWFVKAGGELETVERRPGSSVKDAVAAAAEDLKKRYQPRKHTEARAGRIGR